MTSLLKSSMHSKSQKLTSTIKGKIAEDRAASYLIAQGYTIVERNFRYQKAEIDIIAQKSDTFIFVEVKSRATAFFGYPELAVSETKKQSIRKAAEAYVLDKNFLGPIRFDIVALLPNAIEHFEDAF